MTITSLLIRATAVLAVSLIAGLMLKRRPAAERHLVWLAALAGVVLLPVLAAVVPAQRVPVPASLLAVAAPAQPGQGIGSSPNGSLAPSGTLRQEEPAAGADVAPGTEPVREAASHMASASASASAGISPAAVALGLWLAGALAVLLGTLVGALHVAVVVRRARPLSDAALVARARRLAAEFGVHRPIRLLEGGDAAMPMTFGVFRPALLLPSSAAGWPVARQDAVLRHELAHIRRGDAVGQLVADAACALYWFHPLVWVAAARMRLEREHACDDVVLMAGARASDYAAELLAIARDTRAAPLAARAAHAMARPSRLRTRLTAVLEERARTQRIAGGRLILAAAVALAAVVTAATVTPQAAQALPTAGAVGDMALARIAGDPAGTGGVVAAGNRAAATSHGTVTNAPHPATVDLVGSAADVGGPAAALLQQASACPDSPFRGTGTYVSADASGVHQVIRRVADGVELCLSRSHASGRANVTAHVEDLPVGGRMELAARTADRSQRMEIVRTTAGLEHRWFVDGSERAFDDTAREWRDAMIAVLNSYAQVSAVRGEVASLRGQIASVRGREASLRGEIASARGREASLRGQIASERGRLASLRGEIASIRGHEASLRGQISSVHGEQAALRGFATGVRGRISSLEAAQRATRDADARDRLARELAAARRELADAERRASAPEFEARMAEIERQIVEYGADARVRAIEGRIHALQAETREPAVAAQIAGLGTEGRVREIEGRIAELDVPGETRRIEARIEALDADRRVREIEAAIEPQLTALQQLIRRIR